MKYADYKAVYVDKSLSLKDWQGRRGENQRASLYLGVYGIREDAIRRVLENEKSRKLTRKEQPVGEISQEQSSPSAREPLKDYDPKTKSEAEKLALSNPKFLTGAYEWTHNCSCCVAAWEELQRGKYVTAKPFDEKSTIKSNAIAPWVINGNFNEDPDIRIAVIRAWFKRDITRAFEEWGDGARAMIVIETHAEMKHAFTAKRVGDKIIYFYTQSNKVLDIDKVVEGCTERQKRLWLMRIDNREFSDKIYDAVQNLED